MNDLVKVENEQIVTSSRNVAEHFGREHKNVLRDIENLIGGVLKNEHTPKDLDVHKMFMLTSYTNEQNGQTYPEYLMNRDGFSLLVMGFNGEKAIAWKLKYINAFNHMEKELKVPQLTPNPHYRTRMIGTAIKDIGKTADAICAVFLDVKRGMAMASAMEMIGNAYGIDTSPLRKLLPAADNVGYMNATMVAVKLELTMRNGKGDAHKANLLLENLGLQRHDSDGWHLTEKGRGYGEEKPYTNRGHSGYQIAWNDRVIDLLNDGSVRALADLSNQE